MRRFSRFCAALTVAGGVLAAAVAGPAGAAEPPAVTHAASAPVATSASWDRAYPGGPTRRLTRAQLPDLLTRATTVRPAPVRHLDPTLQAQAAASRSASTEVVASGTNTAALTGAVSAVGGQVLAAVNGSVTATVPTRALATLAGRAGVAAVSPPVRAVIEGDPVNEGVALSNAGPSTTAGSWAAAGIDGTGVKVGIIDAGFLGLASDTNLPSAPTVDDHCANVDQTDHGTAVAEIIHEMAPGATLYLACVDDSNGLKLAEQTMQTAGVTIINTSLGFPGDSRGDGSGAAGSVASIVAAARKAGILWVASAGNDGADHWSGTLSPPDANGVMVLAPTTSTAPSADMDDVVVPGTMDLNGASGSATFDLKWDQWPTSNADVQLVAVGYQCSNDECTCTDALCSNEVEVGAPIVISHTGNQPPTLTTQPGEIVNSQPYPQDWYIGIATTTTTPRVHYDLSYEGDVSDSYLADNYPSQAAAGSIAEPASSPYVLAVGAADAAPSGGVGACFSDADASAHPLETYSSQGPTIDGRVKPDITAYDGVSGDVYGANGFCGTSAASPEVAGSAALVEQANPDLDPAEVQNFLEQRANDGAPANPPNNREGHGLLSLGATPASVPVTAPAGARYVALPGPVGVLDTRKPLGGHQGLVAGGQSFTVTMPVSIPSTATAVLIELAGANATAQTYISAWAGGIAWPGTSNVNLSTLDPTATVMSVITVGSSAQGKTIQVRNNNGKANIVISVVGYYTPGAGAGFVSTPTKPILDTRSTLGGHHAKIPTNGSVWVATGLPADAVDAVVNVTSTNTTVNGYLSATSDCSRVAGVVNYTKYNRADAAIVPLNANKQICISASDSPADVVVALVGYFTNSGGASYVALPAPAGEVDTQTGNGGRLGPILGGQRQTYQGDDIFAVPYTASALMLNLAAANATSAGYLAMVPGGTTAISTSTLNITPGRVVSNSAIMPVRLPNGDYEIANSAGSTRVVVAVSGYFI